jgi:type I restriction enzyme, S subunit
MDGVNPDWPLKPLTRLTTKVGSGATPRGGRRSYPDHGVPFIRSQNVHFDGFTTAGLAFLTDEQARQLDSVTVQADDVLLNITGASIGRVCVAPAAMTGARVNQHVCIIRPDGVKASFLAKYLASPQVQDAIVLGNYGVTREALTKSQILELPVPVPDPGVQDAVLELVDTAMGHRVRAAAHRSAAERAVKRIRQAALAVAYRTAAEAGIQQRLEELLAEPMRNGYSAKPVNRVTDFRVLTLTATTSGSFDTSQFKYTAEEFEPDSPFWVKSGDILVQRGNTAEYVGTPALYEGPNQAYLFPDLMIRVHLRRHIEARFIWYMLLSPQLRNLVREQATGSAGNMPKINQKILNAVPVPIPDEETRLGIIKKLDATLAGAEVLARRTAAATRHIERSSQAILAKAFRGELVGVG